MCLLNPRAATMLVSEFREVIPDKTLHIHTHDTSGTGVSSMIAATNAGYNVVDGATEAMSGLTSQPLLGSISAVVRGTNIDTRFDPDVLGELNIYWENVRYLYAPFKSRNLSGIVGRANSQDYMGTVYQPIVPIKADWVDRELSGDQDKLS